MRSAAAVCIHMQPICTVMRRPIRHGAGGRPIERATPHVPHAGRCRAHIGLTCGYATITAAYMHAMPLPRRGVFAMATSRTIM
ncbi:hypothetical protein NX871_31760, partial [Burkholderia thailandensis]|nr:hypothetical protein [Burkholderia thailandensis]